MTAIQRRVLRTAIDERVRACIGPDELKALRPDPVQRRSLWMPVLRLRTRP